MELKPHMYTTQTHSHTNEREWNRMGKCVSFFDNDGIQQVELEWEANECQWNAKKHTFHVEWRERFMLISALSVSCIRMCVL